MRKETLFNGGWIFFRHTRQINGHYLPIQAVDYDDSQWRSIELPHDMSIESEFSKNNPSGPRGGYASTDLCYYRKHFVMPEEERGNLIRITFQGVYCNSSVYLNGHMLGTWPYGYTTFSYDMTPYLRFGEENVLAVRVNNEIQPASRWYSGTGIYRDVILESIPPLHIEKKTVYITTPIVTEQLAVVNVEAEVCNREERPVRLFLETEVGRKDDGESVTARSKDIVLGPGRTEKVTMALTVENPKLWSADTPWLYGASISLYGGETLADRTELKLGIRDIAFSADEGFLINGRKEVLKGVCLHHDNGTLGACADRDAFRRKLELMKEMGANAVRTTHNPEAPAFLDLCDELGFYVMAESFDEWIYGKRPAVFGKERYRQPIFGYAGHFAEWAEKDLSALVCRDRNHPSIILWSIGNEIEEVKYRECEEITEKLTHIVHQYDMTRPVTIGSNGMAQANKTWNPDMVDVCGYNYADGLYESDHGRVPQRKLVGSEVSSAVPYAVRGDYREFLHMAAAGEPGTQEADPEMRDLQLSGADTMAERQRVGEEVVRAHERAPYVAGMFIWTGVDYLGEPTPYSWPSISSYFAPVDRALFKKDSFYFYQSIWAKQTVLHLLPHWNLEGYEEKPVPVWCFTNCDEVELFVNGVSAGKKVRDTNVSYHLEWKDVVYQPGELKAVGFRQGERYETVIPTVGEPDSLRLEGDRSQLTEGELLYLTVSFRDENGYVVPGAAKDVEISVNDRIELLGVDNGLPTSHRFRGNRICTWDGLARVIVRAKHPGTGIVRVESEGGFEAALQIEITAIK